MSTYITQPKNPYDTDALRLEGLCACVGFDDILDYTLSLNHSHFDHFIVVTSHNDWKTEAVGRKHGATVVKTDLFQKNGRNFNKGAALNAGMAYFQYHGWRQHIDADIALPDNYRRVLFNHTHLERDCLYGADRIDVVGAKNIADLRTHFADYPQHRLRFMVDPTHDRQLSGPIGARLVGNLDGYTPLGYFQLWHSSCQKEYPWSLGTAAHDDVMFSRLWPLKQRRLLPSLFCYHICPSAPQWGENWDGNRKQPRMAKGTNE